MVIILSEGDDSVKGELVIKPKDPVRLSNQPPTQREVSPLRSRAIEDADSTGNTPHTQHGQKTPAMRMRGK